MGSTAVAGELIWPSQNDLYGANVGGAVGDGVMHYERQRRKALGSVAGRNNYVLSGGALPASDPDLTITIPTGSAIIEGHYCEWPATSITLPATNTSHVFVKLVFSGTLITGLEIEDNTSDTPPAASTKLGTATTSGSAVTSTTDARILGPGFSALLTSGTSYSVPAGIYRLRARLFGAGGGGGGGGEGEDVGAPQTGASGAAGTAGGTTIFSSLTANGGGAGPGGAGGGAGVAGLGDGQHGTASGGDVNLTGGGQRGGTGGNGGDAGAASGDPGLEGKPGGDGGYCEKFLSVTPGSTISYSIGAAGTGGSAGSGAGNGFDGSAGQSGQAGRIVLDF
jgi:hypothetical protein